MLSRVGLAAARVAHHRDELAFGDREPRHRGLHTRLPGTGRRREVLRHVVDDQKVHRIRCSASAARQAPEAGVEEHADQSDREDREDHARELACRLFHSFHTK